MFAVGIDAQSSGVLIESSSSASSPHRRRVRFVAVIFHPLFGVRPTPKPTPLLIPQGQARSIPRGAQGQGGAPARRRNELPKPTEAQGTRVAVGGREAGRGGWLNTWLPLLSVTARQNAPPRMDHRLGGARDGTSPFPEPQHHLLGYAKVRALRRRGSRPETVLGEQAGDGSTRRGDLGPAHRTGAAGTMVHVSLEHMGQHSCPSFARHRRVGLLAK